MTTMLNNKHKKKIDFLFKRLAFKSLRWKLVILISLSSFIIIATLVAYISFASTNKAIKTARANAKVVASDYANKIRSELDVSLDAARTLMQSFEGYEHIPESERRWVFSGYLKNILLATPSYASIWTIWEPYSIDNLDDKIDDTGRKRGYFTISYQRAGEEVKERRILADIAVEKDHYSISKQSNREIITEPYFHHFYNEEADSILQTSIVVPIKRAGRFTGVIGIDLNMSELHEMVDTLQLYETGYGFLVSNSGNFIVNSDNKLAGMPFSYAYPELEKRYKIMKNIRKGVSFDFTDRLLPQSSKTYISFVPVTIGNTGTPWSLGIVVPVDRIVEDANSGTLILFIGGLLGMALLILLIYYIAGQITVPLDETIGSLKKLVSGDYKKVSRFNLKSNDEINEMLKQVNLLKQGLTKTAEFALNIGKGKLDTEFNSSGDNDMLGNALVDMRGSLLKARKTEQNRMEEDQKRNWTTQGLAKFSDILRQNIDDINELAYNITSNLIKYLNANQGGIFLYDKEENVLNLIASYAYNRRKHLSKNIEMGEGLVGVCAVERRTIFMTKVPDDYMEITSGLGKTMPTSLIIVPLITEDKIMGVLELASFQISQKHEIEFIERIAENIAATLNSAQINFQTQHLLNQARRQSEQMVSQEEAMRQNMEELQATQEESYTRQLEMEGFVKALNDSSIIQEFDIDGQVLHINDNYLSVFSMTSKMAIGRYHRDYANINSKSEYPNGYAMFWQNLKNGVIQQKIHQANLINGKNIWLNEIFTPIFNSNEKVYKILNIATDITKEKELEKELETHVELNQKISKKMQDAETNRQKNETECITIREEYLSVIDSLMATMSVAELDTDGVIIEANQRFLQLYNVDKADLEDLVLSDMFPLSEDDLMTYSVVWDEVLDGKSKSFLRNIKVQGNHVLIVENYIPVLCRKFEVRKILVISNRNL